MQGESSAVGVAEESTAGLESKTGNGLTCLCADHSVLCMFSGHSLVDATTW